MTLLPRIQMRGYTWSPERGVHPSLTLRGLEPAPQACSPWRALCCQTRAWVPQPQGEALSCPLWEPVWPLSPASPGSPAGSPAGGPCLWVVLRYFTNELQDHAGTDLGGWTAPTS